MIKEYNAKNIEGKWQNKWEESQLFKTNNFSENKENYYILEMFAYPSGKLHAGHLRNYTIGDAIARYKRMNGYNIMHPFGWDSFGLPAENAAISNGVHPSIWTKQNIDSMRRQLKLIGLSYDWDREIMTYTPEYYKFNQKIFIEMYKKGLVYKKKSYVNWCPECNTVLANEQVEAGKCWRHGKTEVIQKELSQWYLKITNYADELLEGHKELTGNWPEQVLAMQKNWIGKSFGAEAVFTLNYDNKEIDIPIFTTRPDTLYGVTYLVLAPEHPLVDEVILKENPELADKIKEMINEDKISRTADNKEKTGYFTGLYVSNPVNDEKVPLWIANYVLMDYGTGAVMAVPAHDTRDYEFANKYDLDIIQVIKGKEDKVELPYTEDGFLINSNQYNGLTNKEAKKKIVEGLTNIHKGKETINYKLHDWLISRQRYWGTPIPVIYDEDGNVYLEEEKNLPVKLPMDIEFNGEGNPLETSEEFKNVLLPNGKKGRRETDTMDTFFDSSWYYLRYLDSKNTELPFDRKVANEWTPVSQYIGGIEHAVMHLLYARFFHKVFRDLGMLDTNEPFERLLSQGMVLGNSYYSNNKRKYLFSNEVINKSGKAYDIETNEELIVKMEKMSKSKNNGTDPEDIVKEYGADAARVFSLFAAPVDKELEWNDNGVAGAYRFINRLYLIVNETLDFITEVSGEVLLNNKNKQDIQLHKKLHQSIKKVTESMEDNFHFNTAIAALMELLNDMTTYRQEIIDNPNNASSESKKIWKETIEKVILMVGPFAPHISEELWEIIGNKESTLLNNWPDYVEELTKETDVTVVVQINGKLRDSMDMPIGFSKEEAIENAMNLDKIKGYIEGKEIVKIIVVPNKLVNIVIK